MEIKNAKLIKKINDFRYIDVEIVDSNKVIPYSFYEGEIKTPVDKIIKNKLDTGKLIVQETSVIHEQKETKQKEFDLWEYRNRLYQKFKKEYHMFLNEGYVVYKDHLFNLYDYDKFNSFFILGEKINFLDVQNQFIELDMSDIKNILKLIFEKRNSLLLSYHNVKERLEKAKTKDDVDNVNWDFDV